MALTLVGSSPFPPLQPKKGGGISFNSTVTLTQCSEKLVQLILHEYSILPEGGPPAAGGAAGAGRGWVAACCPGLPGPEWP